MPNGSDADLEKLVAELRDRVEARRNAGAYPDDLEESLDAHFTQLIGPRSRLAPQVFDELDSLIHELGDYEFSRARIAASSSVPGGELAHRVASRALSRAIDGVLAQSQEQQAILIRVLALLGEISSTVATGEQQVVTQQLDDLQQRLAEQTRSLNELDRRVGDVAARVPGAGVDTFYDETHFTQRFRGEAEDLRARYADLVARFEGCSPVLDIGFGRGELMELVAEMGLEVSGIEVDPHLVALGRGRGLDVARGTAVEYLRTLEPGSLGGIAMIQVIEHLSPQQVLDVVELCAEKVRPGGKVIVETVNPESLFTYARSFWLDPDHVRPVHRGLLEFLFTEAGFQKLEVEWRSPVPPGERLLPVPGDDEQARVINENFERIDRLLFGAQDYALHRDPVSMAAVLTAGPRASSARSETPFGIHQIITAAAPGDAITNVALEFRDVLRMAAPSEIYARHVAPELAGEVRHLREFSRRERRGVLLYHSSIGEPAITSFLRSRAEPLVLVYHNVTPARYFEPWEPAFAELLDLGRRELHALRDRVQLTIADSAFNAAELYDIGYRDIRIVPPVLDPRRLLDLVPDQGTLNYLDTQLGMPFVLFVGQLAPHKRPELLIDAMHVARTYYAFPACLLLVGPHRFKSYANAVISHVRELNLPTAHIVGGVPDANLAAMFRRARAMVTVSEHEGFCVPLVEAMAFGLPIVATASAAIPEVVGDGGLLLPSSAGPSLIAEALIRVVDDADLRRDLAERGRRRVAHFDREVSRQLLLETLMDVL